MSSRRPMHRWRSAILAVVMLATLSGCRERRNDFSLDEFAEASGVVYWKIQVPSDLGDGEHLATAWFRGEDLVRPHTTFFTAPAGSTVRAYFWRDDDPKEKKFVYFETSKESGQSRGIDVVSILDGYSLHSTAASGRVMKEDDALLTIHRGPAGREEVCELRLIRRQRLQ